MKKDPAAKTISPTQWDKLDPRSTDGAALCGIAGIAPVLVQDRTCLMCDSRVSRGWFVDAGDNHCEIRHLAEHESAFLRPSELPIVERFLENQLVANGQLTKTGTVARKQGV